MPGANQHAGQLAREGCIPAIFKCCQSQPQQHKSPRGSCDMLEAGLHLVIASCHLASLPASTAFRPSPMVARAKIGSTAATAALTRRSEARRSAMTQRPAATAAAMPNIIPSASSEATSAAFLAAEGNPAPSSFETLVLTAPAKPAGEQVRPHLHPLL